MSCCASELTDDEIEQKRVNKMIQKLLSSDKKRLERKVKILLLGAGESGKSTVTKQMRIIHELNFTSEEREYYKTLIFDNVFTCMRTILKGGKDLKKKTKNKKLRDLATIIIEGSYEWEGVLTPQIATDMASLWSDEGVQEMYNNRSRYQLPDCAKYYLSDVERIAMPDYIPSEQDILRSRIPTTGVIETKVDVNGLEFIFVDVGGQRTERRKWFLVFPDVTTLLFCVALNGYNLTCSEDNETNRMTESLTLFDETINSKWFIQTPVILFLNKSDLFQELLNEGVSLNVCFDDFKDKDYTINGALDMEKCIEFITQKFFDIMENETRSLYFHVTCATNTNNIEVVWIAVREIVLSQCLSDTGFAV